jgi:nucleotide-binding universal stress UspA family protein
MSLRLPLHQATLQALWAPDWSKVTSQQTKRIGEIVKKRVAQLSKKSTKKLADVKFIGASGDNPSEAIIEAAKNRKCDLIMMASHGRGGVTTLLMGSETNKVLAHSKIPVLVCR